MHYSRDCGFKNHQCQQCGKQGHKDGYCNTYRPQSTDNSSQIKQISNGNRRKHIMLRINDIPIKLQLDTASEITVLSEHTWRKLNSPAYQPTTHTARTTNGNSLRLLGEFRCTIQCNGHSQIGKAFITDIPTLNVLGTDCFDELGLGEIPINAVCSTIQSQNGAHALQSEFSDIFTDKLGHCTKTRVNLHIKPESPPAFRAKRLVAYATIPLVDQELDRLQKLDIISPIEYSDWAAPIVVAKKPNGDIRICGDYSTGLNQALEPHQYPLPIPDEIFAKLANKKIFSVIDLSDAFLQIEVAEESQKYLTINTHRELFMYNRLPFGIKTAPANFQHH
nr:PREDICTED: uncharacterized protein K02A2.6-like [Linepithema humile]